MVHRNNFCFYLRPMLKQITSISLHLGFWLIFFLLPYFIFQNIKPIPKEVENYLLIIGLLLPNTLIALFFYFNYYVLIPRFYLTRKYFVYAVIILLSLFLAVVSVASGSTMLVGIPDNLKPNVAMLYKSVVFRFISVFLISVGLRIYTLWRQAEEDKLKAQLAFLKAQINPHFLFNTINGIYSMAVRKSDNTPDALLKLSSIMRHVFTETTNDFISLEKEMNYISSYIDLQKLRFTPNVLVNYVVDVKDMNKQIAPLIFVPFIENAFKHGVSTEEPCHITILIRDDAGQLCLVVRNRKIKTHSAQTENYGLGIHNTKQRLQHIYPHKHELNIQNEENKFTVSLKLQLQ